MNFIDKNTGWIITSGYIASMPSGNLNGQTKLYETKDGCPYSKLHLS
ncbi:MAG: hypothetical protein ACM34K_03490 [Bacillota bacterium]